MRLQLRLSLVHGQEKEVYEPETVLTEHGWTTVYDKNGNKIIKKKYKFFYVYKDSYFQGALGIGLKTFLFGEKNRSNSDIYDNVVITKIGGAVYLEYVKNGVYHETKEEIMKAFDEFTSFLIKNNKDDYPFELDKIELMKGWY